MKKIIISLFKILVLISRFLNTNLTQAAHMLEDNSKLIIESSTHNKNGRMLNYILLNKELCDHKTAIRRIYNTLIGENSYIEFGESKVIIVAAIVDGQEFSFHHNVLLKNNTRTVLQIN